MRVANYECKILTINILKQNHISNRAELTLSIIEHRYAC